LFDKAPFDLAPIERNWKSYFHDFWFCSIGAWSVDWKCSFWSDWLSTPF